VEGCPEATQVDRIHRVRGGGIQWCEQRIVVGAAGLILRTTDGGASWSRIASPTDTSRTSAVFANPSSGWIVGTRGTIRKLN
jgi:photosystem II stability/assembly factor-like uncharacterized protein